MRYWTEGPFPLEVDDEGLINLADYSRRKFWAFADERSEGISSAPGCYIFTIRKGARTPRPWYIGKAERQDFKRECLTVDKINKYNNALSLSKGAPELWLYARITDKLKKWSKPTQGGYRDVQYLEKMLIGQALEMNPRLININETALLRSMVVPGLLNSPHGGPRKSDSDLSKIFGY